MTAAYAIPDQQLLPETNYTWSSVGPALDGDLGTSIRSLVHSTITPRILSYLHVLTCSLFDCRPFSLTLSYVALFLITLPLMTTTRPVYPSHVTPSYNTPPYNTPPYNTPPLQYPPLQHTLLLHPLLQHPLSLSNQVFPSWLLVLPSPVYPTGPSQSTSS